MSIEEAENEKQENHEENVFMTSEDQNDVNFTFPDSPMSTEEKPNNKRKSNLELESNEAKRKRIERYRI